MSLLPYDTIPRVMQVIDKIATGLTITRACDDVGIAVVTFEKYVDSQPELKDAFRDALRRGHDAMAEALVNINTHPIYGESDPKMATVISGNIKWFLARKAAEIYGDKVTVQHNITADQAIINALSRGKERAMLAHSPAHLVSDNVIDVEHVVIEEGNYEDEIERQLREHGM